MPDPFEPVPTPETAPYWSAAQQRRLSIQQCLNCDRHYFYPRSFCRYCASDNVHWVDVTGRATLHSYVINRRPLPGTEAFAGIIALVKLEEGPTMLSNLVGVEPAPENVKLDMNLVVDFEPRGSTLVPVFRPAEVSA